MSRKHVSLIQVKSKKTSKSTEIIKLTVDLLRMLNQIIPNHLWIGRNYSLYYLDSPSDKLYDCRHIPDHIGVLVHNYWLPENTKNQTSIQLTAPYLIGQIWNANLTVRRTLKRDALYIMKKNGSQRHWQRFSVFLDDIGGNVELYKESIILTTGINPWT